MHLTGLKRKGMQSKKYNQFMLIDLIWEQLYVMGVPPMLDDEEEKIFRTLMESRKKLMSTSLK